MAWRRTWTLALVFVLVFLGAWELFWRAQGLTPSYESSRQLWASQRLMVVRNTVALLGTSRIQADLDPRLLSELLHLPVIQLGINGASPLPILDHLAADPSYAGTVIVDVVPRLIFDASGDPEISSLDHLGVLAGLSSPSARAESVLRLAIRGRLASLRDPLGLVPVLAHLRRGRLPQLPHYTVRADRFQQHDFARVEGGAKPTRGLIDRVETAGRPANESERDRVLLRLEASIAQVAGRGGRVVLVRFPSSGEVSSAEEARYPRRRYWDVLAARTRAVTVHYEDEPSLAELHCPDGSHLDQRDAEVFTRSLATILASRWLAASGAGS